jgi:hypothetical protein
MNNKTLTITSEFPRVGGLYQREDYWQRIEKLRTPQGLPAGTFDFISIHRTILKHQDKPYSLVSPLCLLDEQDRRPAFEEECFETYMDALVRADHLADIHRLFVVNCVDRNDIAEALLDSLKQA